MADIEEKGEIPVRIKGVVTLDPSGDYYGTDVNPDYELLVHDQHILTVATNIYNDFELKLDAIILALGGQIIAGAIQFNEIAPGGKKPKHKELLLNIGVDTVMIDVEVPIGKKWYITSWNGSGEGKGFYQMTEYDDSLAISTTIDTLDSITGWTIQEKISSLTLDTVIKYEGTGSMKIIGNAPHKNDKIRVSKVYSPVIDLSSSEEISVWLKTDYVGKLFKLKIYQGGNNYEWSGIIVQQTDWKKYSFPTAEISTKVNKTLIDKIEIIINAYGQEKTGEIYWFDLIEKATGITESVIDEFFSNSYLPHQPMFPTPIPVTAGKNVRIYVANKDGSSKYFEVGFNGRELLV